MTISLSSLKPFVDKYFSNNQSKDEVWGFFVSHPEFVLKIEKEIDEAVGMFNAYRKTGEQEINGIPVPSSSYLKAIIKGDLPTCKELLDTISQSTNVDLTEKIMMEISKFDFVDTLRPIENCAAALLIGSYRSAMRMVYPYLAEKNAQVASALEEMIALMAISGNKTKLFEGVKHWYRDYEEEGFSKELAEKVKGL